MAELANNSRPDNLPWIANIYTEPDYGSTEPPAPLPSWLQSILIGPSVAYHTFQEAVAEINDWGLLANIKQYQEANNHIMSAHTKIDIYNHNLKGLLHYCDLTEGRLEGALAGLRLERLQHIAARLDRESTWRTQSRFQQPGCRRHGRLI